LPPLLGLLLSVGTVVSRRFSALPTLRGPGEQARAEIETLARALVAERRAEALGLLDRLCDGAEWRQHISKHCVLISNPLRMSQLRPAFSLRTEVAKAAYHNPHL
jgi:hypothetical protein